jgi:GTP cyclohydrolase II
MTAETTCIRHTETPFRGALGAFRLHAYEFARGREHAALVTGRPDKEDAPLVRLQSACLTGTAFSALLCDCRQQLAASLARVTGEGCGVVVYLDQEGRGHGLVEKVRQLSLIAAGEANTATAAGANRAPDLRDYGEAVAILDSLIDVRSVRLLTNNPAKIQALQSLGFTVYREPLETPPTEGNRDYLRVKKLLMGHLLTRV